jgi:hypothetical protein
LRKTIGTQSLKQASIDVIKRLPDSSEEIMYELNLADQVLEGLSDEEKSKTSTTDELLKQVEKWQHAG